MSAFVSHAQYGEDVRLWRALGHVADGRYIDVGAADPDDMSVTRAFYDRGWRGVKVEPVASHASRLRERRPRDTTLEVALASSPGERTLHEVHTATFNPSSNYGTIERQGNCALRRFDLETIGAFARAAG